MDSQMATDSSMELNELNGCFWKHLSFLREILAIIDSHVDGIEKWNRDNENDAEFYDDIIYSEVGLGFAACQQFMESVRCNWGVDKKTALSKGPEVGGKKVACAINTAANCWKHQAEWDNKDKLSSNAKKTREEIKNLGFDPDKLDTPYEILGLLTANTKRMGDLLPILFNWANDISEYAIKNGTCEKTGWWKKACGLGDLPMSDSTGLEI